MFLPEKSGFHPGFTIKSGIIKNDVVMDEYLYIKGELFSLSQPQFLGVQNVLCHCSILLIDTANLLRKKGAHLTQMRQKL